MIDEGKFTLGLTSRLHSKILNGLRLTDDPKRKEGGSANDWNDQAMHGAAFRSGKTSRKRISAAVDGSSLSDRS
jgi:hypothetical protein